MNIGILWDGVEFEIIGEKMYIYMFENVLVF